MASLSESQGIRAEESTHRDSLRAEDSSRQDDEALTSTRNNAHEEREAKESEKAWEDHVDARLRFLPKKDAVLTDIVEQRIVEEKDFHKKVDPRVLERFVASEQKTSSQRLNLSCLSLQAVPIKQSLFATLQVLSLRDNQLTSIPIEVFTALYTVESLNLSHNVLTCLPDTISALVNLRKLTASHNHLEGPMGPGLFMCLHLREIDLSHNAITALHEDIKMCRELQCVLMGDNQLDHVPPSLQDLPMLRALDLRHNPIDLQDLPDRLVLLNEQYALARSASQRRALVHRATAMRTKVQEAYTKTLLTSTKSFQL